VDREPADLDLDARIGASVVVRFHGANDSLRPAMDLDTLDHREVEHDGFRTHSVAGGEGKPILFLHGFPQFWFLWRNQLATLGDSHSAYAPDMRGFNLTDKPQD